MVSWLYFDILQCKEYLKYQCNCRHITGNTYRVICFRQIYCYSVWCQILHIFFCKIILERKYCIGSVSTSNDWMIFLSVSWTPWWLFFSCLGWLPWLCWEHYIETLLDTTKWITLWVGFSISKIYYVLSIHIVAKILNMHMYSWM